LRLYVATLYTYAVGSTIQLFGITDTIALHTPRAGASTPLRLHAIRAPQLQSNTHTLSKYNTSTPQSTNKVPHRTTQKTTYIFIVQTDDAHAVVALFFVLHSIVTVEA